MARKDIFDRIDTTSGSGRADAGARPPSDAEVTRVSRSVVRRRARSPDEDAPAADAGGKPTVIRRRAQPAEPEAAPASSASAPRPAARPEPTPPPVAQPASRPSGPTPEEMALAAARAEEEARKAAEAKERAAAEQAAAASQAAPAPVPVVAEAEPGAVAAAPEAAPVAAAAPPAEPAPPPRRAREVVAGGQTRDPRFAGLGSAVVALPPGYDPSNPQANRPRPARDVGGDTSADSRRGRERREVTGPEGGGSDGGDRGRRGRGRRVQEAGISALRPRRRAKKGTPKASSPQPKAQKRKVRVDGAISVSQLAHELGLKAPMLIKKLIELGNPVTINEMLDVELASIVAAEFEYEIENVGFNEDAYLQHVPEEVEDEEMSPRPPVVTIMGHVDHGKTTLLDTIRSAKVAAGEAGGITQHIGAYQVEANGQLVTFLDTPGHAAFSAMRARGASITDIVILVVAADDGPQPQTIEAINHAKAAGVPLVVAVNKCDKPGVNPENARNRLSEHGLLPEEWGGETQYVNVSALKATGIDELLEAVLLQAEVLDIRANYERHAEGTVIEAKMEQGRGPVATVLVQQGTLKSGDHVVLGSRFGKVRAMMDFRGQRIKEAGPATPVEIFGLSDLPNVGDSVIVVKNEKNARTLAEHRAELDRQAALAKSGRRTLDDLRRMAGEEERKELLVVLKADVQGSLEALKHAILGIEVEGCSVRILHDGVGPINESDVSLVQANDGLLVGFNVKVDARARRSADEAGVKPELYSVIYDVLDRVKGLLTGMLEPVYEEEHQGSAEVRALFKISRIGTVAGCYITDGKIGRNNAARVYRAGKEIWSGKIAGLRRFKDDVREVSSGYECGISLDGFDEVAEGDVIEAFDMVRVDPVAAG
jgi:translation initiation factor IF-2